MGKKYLLNFYDMKQHFSGPLFFEKRAYSLVGPLRNPNFIENENYIFAKNATHGRLRCPIVALDGQRKFHIQKPEKFTQCIAEFIIITLFA